MYLLDTGKVEVTGMFGPTLNFLPGRDLRYAVSFDDDPPHVVTLVSAGFHRAAREHGLGENRRRQRAPQSDRARDNEVRLSHPEDLDGGSRGCPGEDCRGSRRCEAQLSGTARELSPAVDSIDDVRGSRWAVTNIRDQESDVGRLQRPKRGNPGKRSALSTASDCNN